jgi:hypothetical protein
MHITSKELFLYKRVRVRVMVFKTIFNNISVISLLPVLFVEETREPRENH